VRGIIICQLGIIVWGRSIGRAWQDKGTIGHNSVG
jgi:hypothetical protein